MSKIKVKGHDSGTGVITIEAPNTSTDRTIVLPDATGTLLTADGDGSSLTGVGVAGISSSADATAITIDSSEQVGIGQAPTDYQLVVREPNGDKKVLELSTGDSTCRLAFSRAGDPAAYIDMKEDGATGTGGLHFGTGTSNTPTTILKLTSDGRGVSEFTTRAWCSFDGTGTVSINDSHNVSSLTDLGTGSYRVSFSSALSNSYPAVAVSGIDGNNYAVNPCLHDEPSDGKVDIRCIQEQNSSFNIIDTELVTVMVNGD